MIISRTPFRISFFGGGTDYPVWYKDNAGGVISVSINKYCYITGRYIPPFFDYKYLIRYHLREEAKCISEIKHPSVRECLKYLDFKEGVEIVHHADLPARSGLGSSSSFTVGMLNTLYALRCHMATKKELALNAIHVEQDLIGESVGSQDQTCAAFGGLNKITFGGSEHIGVSPIFLSKERSRELQRNLVLVFTGFSRSASEIAKKQIECTKERGEELRLMSDLVDEAFKILQNPKRSMDDFGCLLDDQWQIKRGLTNLISNSDIDSIYEAGKAGGALGGKLCGAGGGGFMLFYIKPELREKLKENLKKYLFVPFSFEYLGSQIIYHSNDNNFEC